METKHTSITPIFAEISSLLSELYITRGWMLVSLTALMWGLCVGENIALGKPATSNGEAVVNWTADKAVDGNTDPVVSNHHCWHGPNDAGPEWLTVDLQAYYSIQRVVLFNRDIFQERLRNAAIEGFIIDPHFPSTGSVCGLTPGSVGAVITVECNAGTTGRYVRVLGPQALTICEAQIFGTKVGDIVGIPDCSTAESLISWGKKLTDAVNLGVASSNADCINLCHYQPGCSVAGFDNGTKMCTGSFKPINPIADSQSTLFFVP